MGYSTDFYGSLKFNKALDMETYTKLKDMNEGEGPSNAPGSYCDWTVNKEATELMWNGAEKFYDYIPWLKYLITNLFAPKGFILNGQIEWQGEDRNDRGLIVVNNNKIEIKTAKVSFE